MTEYVISFDGVWKKFKKGEDHDSLRDLIPAVARRLFRRNYRSELGKREFWALKDFSFTVRKGESVGIIGRNGSGKTTTLKLLSGILVPNCGTIKIQGMLAALIELGAGFHPDLTGRENIYLNGAICGMSRGDIKAQFDKIVEFSELQEFIDTPVKRYSSGMYARLGFSVAAHLNPDILLIDEVLSVGDISFQQKCLQRINLLRKQGAAIVFVSHNMEAIRNLCQRVILLEHGRKECEGDAAEVISAYGYRTVYRPDVVEADQGPDCPVAIRKVAFLDSEGRQVDSFCSGKKITLRVTLEALQLIPRPVFGVGFFKPDGTCVFAHNSKMDRWPIPDLKGLIEFEIEYENIFLQPGKILVHWSLQDMTYMRSYIYTDRIYDFMVRGVVATGEGIIHWPHVWRVKLSHAASLRK